MFRLVIAVVVKLFDKLVKQRERKWSLGGPGPGDRGHARAGPAEHVGQGEQT
jgi:hypothetical protein